MPVPKVKRDATHGFKFYVDPPRFSLRTMPVDAKIILAPEGGFWVIDGLTGIRYRRVTMADLPKHTSWNTRGKGRYNQEDGDE